MSTPFEDVKKKFLAKINDTILANKFITNKTLADEIIYDWMDDACTKFTKCKKDLSQRDLTNKCFTNNLSPYEIMTIVQFMLCSWVAPYVNDILNLKPILADSEFKIYSQANFLDSKVALQSKLEENAKDSMRDYTYDTADWTDF